jgi:hypothetical protein
MPRKSTTKRSTTRKRSQRGKGVMDILRFVKNNHLISRGLGLIPHPGAQAASAVAGLVGLGRRKSATRKSTTRKSATRKSATRKRSSTTMPSRARKGMRGRGIFGDLGSGIGSVFGGLGSGVGSIAHGLFGNGRKGNLSGRPHRSVIHI